MHKKAIYYYLGILIVFFISFSLTQSALSADSNSCFVYFTGVGCPHCSQADPVILEKTLAAHPDIFILEYEVYQERENAPLLMSYNDQYQTGLGIPLLIISPQEKLLGDKPIISNIEQTITESPNNECLLLDQSSNFSQLNIDSLPGKPKIWQKDRILIALDANKKLGEKAKKYFLASDLSSAVENNSFKKLTDVSVPLSGKKINFNQGIQIGSWILAWNDNSSTSPSLINNSTSTSPFTSILNNSTSTSALAPLIPASPQTSSAISWPQIISLAGVDAINPCALAVLALMLSAILIYNPHGKKDIILAGLSFILAVFIFYFLYGFLIIKAFKLIGAIAPIRLWLYRIMAGVAILLGILELKDFFCYRPGGFMTEMPLSLRPKVKKIISGITTPRSAFVIGIFVTFFLLPCTIGPYIIAGGILSQQAQIAILPYLFVYNLIFITPMLLIILAVYGGTHGAMKDINQWRKKNIRQLHLVAGVILIILGFVMLLGA